MGGEEAEGRNALARGSWKQDPDAVKTDILRVAREEFATHGLSGARIDHIAARTRTSKRMIYYYFGDKDGLYRRVLEEAYRTVRGREASLDLAGLPPVEALRKLVGHTFDHHRDNPEFIRLVMIENIHHGAHLAVSDVIRELNSAAIENLEDIYGRGLEAGLFREGLSALQLHWQISALSFFSVSNRATFTLIFGDSLYAPDRRGDMRRDVEEMVLRYVMK
ncbi:MAG: TetR family transcriptional regulator [Rhodospirillum sp.]|nr:TetR family transcriptional regulator [Rhodospirillum sp.]MCF8490647.1 TetR family transcriptional regulator [Rhodospirillum sp.]MCF8500723.1 TetR family transcriptional regulator [Rhodospirillum sp.]